MRTPRLREVKGVEIVEVATGRELKPGLLIYRLVHNYGLLEPISVSRVLKIPSRTVTCMYFSPQLQDLGILVRLLSLPPASGGIQPDGDQGGSTSLESYLGSF